MLTGETDIGTILARRGITRRQLVKFCNGVLATLAMPERYLAQTVAAISKARKPVLIWLQFQDCTGCSESMLQSSHPDVADVVLLSVEPLAHPSSTPVLTHVSKPGEIVELARVLFGFAGRVLLCRIPVDDLSVGVGLGPRALVLAEEAVRRLEILLGDL